MKKLVFLFLLLPAVAMAQTTIDVSDLNQEFSMAMPPKVRLELLLKQMYLVDVRLLPYLNWIFN